MGGTTIINTAAPDPVASVEINLEERDRMSERWAFCDRCHRWFYAQRVLHSDKLRCPVCDASPSLVRDKQPENTTSN